MTVSFLQNEHFEIRGLTNSFLDNWGTAASGSRRVRNLAKNTALCLPPGEAAQFGDRDRRRLGLRARPQRERFGEALFSTMKSFEWFAARPAWVLFCVICRQEPLYSVPQPKCIKVLFASLK